MIHSHSRTIILHVVLAPYTVSYLVYLWICNKFQGYSSVFTYVYGVRCSWEMISIYIYKLYTVSHGNFSFYLSDLLRRDLLVLGLFGSALFIVSPLDINECLTSQEFWIFFMRKFRFFLINMVPQIFRISNIIRDFWTKPPEITLNHRITMT